MFQMKEMELSPRISCWTTRIALLVTFVVLMVNFDNQHNVANASPLPLSGFEDYNSEGRNLIGILFRGYFKSVNRQTDRMNDRDQPSLYELLLQRELLADKLDADARGHLVVRKSDRSPSLR